MSAIEEIAAERRRQIEAEGWSAEHDDTHTDREIALAAASYCLSASDNDNVFSSIGRAPLIAERNFGWISLRHLVWPWEKTWFKPKNPRRDLIKAGALIVAEIERLDRASAKREAA